MAVVKTKAKQQATGSSVKEIEITDNVLMRMLRSEVYRREFDFVGTLARDLEEKATTAKKKKKGCGCGAAQKVTSVSAEQLSWMRQRIYGLPVKKKLRLKQMLQVNSVKLSAMNDEGRPVRLKF